MTYTVYVSSINYKGNPNFADDLLEEFKTGIEEESESKAKELSTKYPDEHVFIFVQKEDGSTGFLNPSGYEVNAENWVEWLEA